MALQFLTAIFATSCKTPQQRIDKIVSRNPDLIKRDSILIDTVLVAGVPAVRVDTLVYYRHGDTIRIERDRYSTQIVAHRAADGVQWLEVTGGCDSVTVYVPFHHFVPFNKIEYKKRFNWRSYVSFGVLLAFIFIAVYPFKSS